MPSESDFWQAFHVTKVLHTPRQLLQTFGATTVHYHVVSELMDEAGRIRIRAGKVHSERPMIITPTMSDSFLQGFAPEAREFMASLAASGRLLRIINYGLQFRKDDARQEVIDATLADATARVVAQAKKSGDDHVAVLIGADSLWEVSLLRFMVDYIDRSLPLNLQEMHEKQAEERLLQQYGSPETQIERDFKRAETEPGYIKVLGERLQRMGLFEQYEDRFYALLGQR